MAEPKSFRVRGAGVELQAWEWPGDEPAVFLAHATGFHGRCWDRVAERLPGVRVIAVDMRGHGRSEKPEPPYRWPAFGDDVAAVVRELGLGGAIGVGHSKGGYAVTRAAALEPGAFAALLLVDPVIGPRGYRRQMAEDDHFAARRRNAWDSPEEMVARFRGREPFSRWDPEVLEDYCRWGLLPNPAGEGYVLACPPRIEAAVYAGAYNEAPGEDIYELIAQVQVPVRVLRARPRDEANPMDMSGSPTAPDLAAHFPRGEDVPVPQYSHFIPMEDPGFIAAEIDRLRR
ncbi:alpha/beta hydrolase [Tepidiforma sp.]|uniref:alpha/beta fold hydrolase n=1 Tax=Tepidiforma sp. TaxID=2682230 RepID=UPI002ADDA05B|nr:alpha/beta hydrolase [Tepidiforma sp.]